MSLDTESTLNLEQDEAAVVAFLAEHDGRLTHDADNPGLYHLDLRPQSEPHERYLARIAWSAYPHQPPSVRFVPANGSNASATCAWPTIPGYRPSSSDICKPFTAEGFNLHPDWRTGPDAWRTSGNPFLYVVSTLQYDLDNNYTGRSA